MWLTQVRVFHFRNFEEQELHLSRHTNLFVGRNGQGKTNLLEAIYILAYGRSFRTAHTRECIRHGDDSSAVDCHIETGHGERTAGVRILGRDKQLLVNGKQVSIDEFLGSVQVLAFTNSHLQIVRGSPSERRSFLDRGMVSIYPGHVRNLASFGRALKQRNAILAAGSVSGRTEDQELLASWDEALVKAGSRIVWNRRKHVLDLKKVLPERLFGEERLKMHYVSTVAAETGDLQEIEDAFRKKVDDAHRTDERLGYTTVGPHRDELKLFVDGKELSGFGSAGQQRSALLSLYFAQMELHRASQGFYPVFLVDDVEAELDDQRLRVFLDYLGSRTQVFLTTAKESFLPPIADETRRFEVRAGSVR